MATKICSTFMPVTKSSSSFGAEDIITNTALVPTIFATSAHPVGRSTDAIKLTRKLLDDRKGFFDHLKPMPLLMSTCKVISVQGSLIVSYYVKDQVELEASLDKLVSEGHLSALDAEDHTEEWEKREWKLSWQSYPEKIMYGLAKFHSVTLLIRLFESMFEKFYTGNDKIIKLDRLTMDTFKGSKRMAKSETDSNELTKGIFSQCLWANAFSFLADYTVHQAILCYVYYMYWHRKRRSTNQGQSTNDDESIQGPIAMSLAFKSAQLMVFRSASWVLSSAGGAIGTFFYPGWGTLFCSQMGDAIVDGMIVSW